MQKHGRAPGVRHPTPTAAAAGDDALVHHLEPRGMQGARETEQQGKAFIHCDKNRSEEG